MSWISRALGKKKADTQWWVGQFEEDDKPVIVRARSAMPATPNPKHYPSLAVITWRYRQEESGMPSPKDDARMNDLEDRLDSTLVKKKVCIQTASRTGNGLREWNYYARNEEEFMAALNWALGHLPPFPIEVAFYDEPGWDSFQDLLAAKE
jgi:hypothetical protein